MKLPETLAFHYLGCAVERDGMISVPGRVGALIDCLAERVSHVVVLAFDPPDTPSLEDKAEYVLASENVTFRTLGPKGALRDVVSRRRRIRRIVREHRSGWDAVILKLPNRRVGAFFGALGSRPLIAIVVGHTPSVVATARWPLWRKAFVYTYALIAERTYAQILRRAVATFVNSEELRKRYEHVAGRIELAPLSSRRRRFAFATDDRMQGTEVDLMINGRITAEKGVFEALDAFAQLRRSDLPQARLNVIGDGPDLGRLLERAKDLGVADGVVAHGWVPVGEQLFDLYRQMDILLLPSYAEGLPYSVWEAMANSVLVICTPVGGLKAAFTDGREVLFVPVKDVEAIVAAVRRLHRDRDLRRALLAAGYAIAEPTSLDAIVDALLEPVSQASRP